MRKRALHSIHRKLSVSAERRKKRVLKVAERTRRLMEDGSVGGGGGGEDEGPPPCAMMSGCDFSFMEASTTDMGELCTLATDLVDCIETAGTCTAEEMEMIEGLKACPCEGSCGDMDMGGDMGSDKWDDDMEHHDDEDEGGGPACIEFSACGGVLIAEIGESAPNCEQLTDLQTCVSGSQSDNCKGDEEFDTILAAWLACTCDNECDGIAETSDTVLDPLTWKSPWLSQAMYAGTEFVIPGYAEDSFGSFFRYDLTETHDSAWNKSPWDMFSAFSDVKYDWVESEGRCMPFIKLEGSDDDMVMLKSFDGVDIDCALDVVMSEQHVKNAEVRKVMKRNSGRPHHLAHPPLACLSPS